MGAGIPDLSFSRFAIAFLLIFMLARAAIGKFRFATPLGLTEICIVATTIAFLAAAALIDKSNLTIQSMLSWYCMPLLMYFLGRNLVRDRNELHKLLWAIMLFGFAAATYAIYESSTGHILFTAKETDISELNTAYGENLRMLRGLLDRTGNFGRVFLSTIPVTFYLFFENKSGLRKMLLVGALVVQFYGMFLTYNRTSWYALMIGLFILQVFYPQFRKAYIVLVCVAAIVLWITWDQVTDSAVVQERVNSKVSTLDDRELRWKTAENMWKEKPIQGWGFEGYRKESGRFRIDDGRGMNWKSPENDFWFILVGSGLIGFLPYFIFLLAPFINSLRLFFQARAPDWSGFIKPETIAIYWVSIICYAIGSYTQTQNVAIVKMIPFAMAGAIIGTHQHWLQRRAKGTLALK
jgi:O-antigen ligase